MVVVSRESDRQKSEGSILAATRLPRQQELHLVHELSLAAPSLVALPEGE